jgi:putative addiction module killer protein
LIVVIYKRQLCGVRLSSCPFSGMPADASRSLGSGLMELRIDTGPGYRVYFSQAHTGSCLILCAGSKRTQAADIERARKWLEEARRLRNH